MLDWVYTCTQNFEVFLSDDVIAQELQFFIIIIF